MADELGSTDVRNCGRRPNPSSSFEGWAGRSSIARRTSTFLSCAFREQGGDQASQPL